MKCNGNVISTHLEDVGPFETAETARPALRRTDAAIDARAEALPPRQLISCLSCTCSPAERFQQQCAALPAVNVVW